MDSKSLHLPPAPRREGPHLLDVSMFWNPVGGVQQVLGIKRAHLAAHGWQHSLMAPVVAQAGGLGELEHGVGHTVAGRHELPWADAIAATLCDPDPRPVAAALQRARAHAWPRILNQWTGHYQRALRPLEVRT